MALAEGSDGGGCIVGTYRHIFEFDLPSSKPLFAEVISSFHLKHSKA